MKNNIKYVLESQGRSKAWLSRELNIHITTVYRWCSNSTQPGGSHLKAVSDLLNVPMEELIN